MTVTHRVSPQSGAVVLGAFATGLHVARILGRLGVNVALVALGEHDLAQHSKFVSETAYLGNPRNPTNLFHLLQEHVGRWKDRVLVPTSDLALEALARNRTALNKHYRMYVPDWDTVSILLRKDRTYETAQSMEIELPLRYGTLSADLLRKFRGPFPALLKPMNSVAFQNIFKQKVFVISNREDLQRRQEELDRFGLAAELQELIPGPDTCSYNYTAFLDTSGRLVAECALRKIRKSPPLYGIGRVIETLDDPLVWERLRIPTLNLLRKIGWYGPVSSEFKLNPRNGRFVLIEINGRCSFVHRLASACGIDYPWLIYQAALSCNLQTTFSNGWRGGMIHLHADILNAIFGDEEQHIGWQDYVSPYLRPKVFAVWDWSDPLPFLAEWCGTLRRAVTSKPKDLRKQIFWGS